MDRPLGISEVLHAAGARHGEADGHDVPPDVASSRWAAAAAAAAARRRSVQADVQHGVDGNAATPDRNASGGGPSLRSADSTNEIDGAPDMTIGPVAPPSFAVSSCVPLDMRAARCCIATQTACAAFTAGEERTGLQIRHQCALRSQAILRRGSESKICRRRKSDSAFGDVRHWKNRASAAQPRRKKILTGMRVKSLVFRREEATSDETFTRRSGKLIELDRLPGSAWRRLGRKMSNLQPTWS